jgi:hypothetical protein
VFRMLWMSIRLPFFAAAMIFGALVHGLALFVLARMRLLGHRVGIWRTHRDWALYREYWRVASERNWSRVPIMAGLLSFVLALCLMWFSICGAHIPH